VKGTERVICAEELSVRFKRKNYDEPQIRELSIHETRARIVRSWLIFFQYITDPFPKWTSVGSKME
jgi:hypothetical protein